MIKSEVEKNLSAAHEEHGSGVHAEHPQLRGNTQNVDDENAHLGRRQLNSSVELSNRSSAAEDAALVLAGGKSRVMRTSGTTRASHCFANKKASVKTLYFFKMASTLAMPWCVTRAAQAVCIAVAPPTFQQLLDTCSKSNTIRAAWWLHVGPIVTTVETMTSPSHRTHLPTFVAGGAAGCVAAVLTCPLEVVKTKLQSRHLARAGFLSVVRSTWLTEGYKGFFRGLVPLLSGQCPERLRARAVPVFRHHPLQKQNHKPLTSQSAHHHPSGVLPGRAMYFSVYTFCKENAASVPVSSHVVHIAAAAAAGVTSQTVLSPIYVVKTRLQVK
jgi:hypothetical protein